MPSAGIHVVKVEIGTPSKAVYPSLDTGSSNMYVNDADNAYCKSMSDGTTTSALPIGIADAISKSFDGKYSSDDKDYIFDCSKVNRTLLSVDFGGFNISANISNFVTPS